MQNRTYKISIFIKKEENIYYAYCTELAGCYALGSTYQEAKQHIQEALNLYLESFSEHEAIEYLDSARNNEVTATKSRLDLQLKLTAAQAEKLLADAGFTISAGKDNYRIYLKDNARFILPLQGDKSLSQQMVEEVLNLVEK